MDAELTTLLLSELERHLAVLERARGLSPDEALEVAARTVHALKGSAGLAGEHELAAVMLAYEQRLKSGDASTVHDAVVAITSACARLAAGQRAVSVIWPVPPPELGAREVNGALRAAYTTELGDRLARLDAILVSGASGAEVNGEIFRHVHTMKGAASAVSDEPMAWFCHGLEEQLRGSPSAVEELGKHRNTLGMLLEDPAGALATLRGIVAKRTAPLRAASTQEVDGTIRVPTHAVARLLDHASGIAVAREQLPARVGEAQEQARAVRRWRSELAEALRLIGPSRPWGAPAAALRRVERAGQALGELADELERGAEGLRRSDLRLKTDAFAVKRVLASMRQTTTRDLFDRLAAAALAEARRTGRKVTIQTDGAEEPVDRRLVEALVEPCLQLTRNAVAHGIEPPDARLGKGKAAEATVTLTARRRGNRLSIGVSDDGAGVDIATLRARAVDEGVVSEVLAEAADDRTLLELLFVPGFSMRSQSPDLLAGRGVGLDITLASVERLGGTIRLSTLYGRGFEARVDVPIESGLISVLWVEAEGVQLAVPAANALRVSRARPTDTVPHLASCLEPRAVARARHLLEVDALDGAPSFVVGLDAVGQVEEVLVRSLSPMLARLGPYAGSVVRGDGAVRFAIDAGQLAPRARALGRVPEGRISEPPSRRGSEWSR